MSVDDVKNWLRCQIDNSILKQNDYDKNVIGLHYNKQYLRALKLSKINGKVVNPNDFIGGEKSFDIFINEKTIYVYSRIRSHLRENYTKDFSKITTLIYDVFNEYEKYKDYEIS